MSVIQSIKEQLFGEQRETEIGFLPKERRENSIPKFKLRKEVYSNGQVYLPKEVRETDRPVSDIESGDPLSLDIFAPEYGGNNRYGNYEIYVDVTVTSGNRITIPKEVREELDIQPGDEIAIHGYVRFE